MTSKAEADYMKGIVQGLENEGFNKGQIGAVLFGMGMGFFAAHNGNAEAFRALDSVRLAIEKPEKLS